MHPNSPMLRQWLLVRTISAAGGKTTVASLSRETGMSDKTIRRDVELLHKVGFPIQESVGEYGRKTYALDTSAIPLLTFTYDEALALHLCRSSAVQFAGTFIAASVQEAFRKIRASLTTSTCEYLERMLGRVARTSVGGDYSGKAELLDQILIGLEESKAVFVTYRSERSTEPVTYDLYPLGLVEHRGSLYIVGFSPDHKEIRTWKLDRMLDAEVTKVPFQRPAAFDLSRFLAGSFGVYHGKGDVVVRVHFAPSVARYASEKQMHASQTIAPQRDGGVIAQWQLTSTVEIRSYILSFGAAAEVLEPAEFREEIQAEIGRMLAVYRAAEQDGRSEGRGKKSRKGTATHHRPK